MSEVIFALDTFKASQHGQLSVLKNDQLILLNDDHYYWWYVQELKTNSMGFVPAELLELPNERLARQNSLRNQKVQVEAEEPRQRPKRQCSVRFTPAITDCPELSADLSSSENEMPMTVEIVAVTVHAPTPLVENVKTACAYDAVPGMAANLDRMTDLERRLRLLINENTV